MKNKSGFTLVELLVSIGIIAILVTIVVIAVNPQRIMQDTNDSRDRTEMQQLKTSLQLYFNDNNSYPTSGLANLKAALEPTYIRALPSVASGTFEYVSSATDYQAGVNLNNQNTDDANSVTKCSSAAGGLIGSQNYRICPD